MSYLSVEKTFLKLLSKRDDELEDGQGWYLWVPNLIGFSGTAVLLAFYCRHRFNQDGKQFFCNKIIPLLAKIEKLALTQPDLLPPNYLQQVDYFQKEELVKCLLDDYCEIFYHVLQKLKSNVKLNHDDMKHNVAHVR